MKVRIVEDDSFSGRLLQGSLEKRGTEVVLTHEGSKAPEVLQAPGISSLVIPDWIRPWTGPMATGKIAVTWE